MMKTTYKLGPFGSNLIGEWLEYRETGSAGGLRNACYRTKILCTCDDIPRPYIFTDVDAEDSDRYMECGIRVINPEIAFWDCMCHNVDRGMYVIHMFNIGDCIWDD